VLFANLHPPVLFKVLSAVVTIVKIFWDIAQFSQYGTDICEYRITYMYPHATRWFVVRLIFDLEVGGDKFL
jgi:hypothetical protein